VNRRRLVAVAAAGLAASYLVALATAMPSPHLLIVIVVAWTAALPVGALGLLAQRRARRRTIRTQVSMVVITAVAAAAAAVLAVAWAMFISAHDLQVLVVVVVAAASIGCVAAVVLGQRLGDEALSLRETARRIGAGEAPGQVGSQSEELADVAHELLLMSGRLDASRQNERAAEDARRELVAWVSHDLRTPLAGIRAMVEALEDGLITDDETIARYRRTIRQETEHLGRLIEDLFELSRLNSATLRLRPESASLTDLVSDALAALAPAARAEGVLLDGEILGAHIELRLSTPEVGRAVRNLLENAIRHTPASGTIRVRVGRDDTHAFVSVTDACGGIPREDLVRVFEPAFRGSSARTPADHNGGLGLAIVRGVAEAHQGDVTVRNHATGCEFVLRLAAAPSDRMLTHTGNGRT
jgi:signal transduction histidine kinase